MWFWSVSWPTNCPVNFSFFLVGLKKLTRLRDQTIFLSTLLIFLSSLDIREWPIFKKDWTWNSRVDKKRDNFLLADQKNEKLTGQLVGWRDWPKPYGRPSWIWQFDTVYRQIQQKIMQWTFSKVAMAKYALLPMSV